MMIYRASEIASNEDCWHGLLMSADAYLSLSQSQKRYELVNGVIIMSPSPSRMHQLLISRLIYEISFYLNKHPIGQVYPELDVNLTSYLGREAVYRPDIVFLDHEQIANLGDKIDLPPKLVIEIISPDSRQFDSITKKNDYQSAGVQEYWLIDPLKKRCTFYVRQRSEWIEQSLSNQRYTSSVLAEFELDTSTLFNELTR